MSTSANRTIIIVGVLLLLGLVRVGQMLLGNDGPPPVSESPLATLAVADATKLSLTQGDASVELTRTDETWSVAGDVADGDAVRAFLERLRDAKVRRIASEDANDLARFGLDDAHALRVTVFAGEQTLTDLRLAPTSGGGAYVFVAGTKRVYDMAGSFPEGANTDSWRSRAVLGLVSESIREVELRGKTEHIVLRRTDAAFELEQGGTTRTVSLAKGETFLATLANMRATGFLSPEEAPGLDHPDLTVLVHRENAPDVELKFGSATSTGDRSVKTNQRKTIFQVSALDVRSLEEPDLAPAASTVP